MTIYTIESPDGERHKVEAPEGATEAEAINCFASQW